MDQMETTAATSSSSKLILSIIAILVVVGIGYAVFRSDDGIDGDTSSTTPVATDETTFSGNLFELAARGGSWKCTWESDTSGVAMTGTVFVDRGKFKSDAEITSGGMNITAHTISDGAYVYSWTSVMPTTGFKFRVTEGPEGVPPQGTTAQAEQFASMYDYDCEPWSAESGTFALPSGVTFTETTTQ